MKGVKRFDASKPVVNVAADVPERALGSLRIGQGATIRVAAFPSRRFTGHVERVSDQVDSAKRTVEALLHVPNPTRSLKPGMFATVVLHVRLAAEPGAERPLSVPASAVVTDGDARYVFVQVAPLTFERRAVELALSAGGARAGTRVVVLSGLAPGERVVTRGAFTLKSELAKAAFAEDEH